MITSSIGNIFRVTGPLCEHFTGHRWIPFTKAGKGELWCFLWSAPEQTVESTIQTPTVSDIKWHLGKGIMKILGVYFSNYERAGKLEQNWVGKIDKIIRCIKSWEKRDLSIVGKIIVTKTFLLSQFIFVMQALLLPLNILKNINTILFKFIWKKRLSNKKAFEKVWRDVLCDNYSEGGLNMINIIDMQHSLSLKWLQRVYLNKEASFACIPLYYYEKLGNDLSALRSNLTSKYFKGLEEIRPEFWRCAMEIWLNSNVAPEPEEVNIEHQPLWNNDNIKYRNTVLYYKNWVTRGYSLVGDLFVDGTFLTLDRALDIMGQDGRVVLQYNALYNALPAAWRDPDNVEGINTGEPTFCGLEISTLTSKHVREKLLQQRRKPPCCIAFWGRKFPNFNVDSRVFLSPFSASKESRLRVLQWKITHNIFPTNILSYKMRKSDSSDCSFCGERDFIEHFFCSNAIVRPLWSLVENEMNRMFGIDIELSDQQKLFGISRAEYPDPSVDRLNHIILIAKMCISKFKYGEYNDIKWLLRYEISLRKVYDQWLNSSWELPISYDVSWTCIYVHLCKIVNNKRTKTI